MNVQSFKRTYLQIKIKLNVAYAAAIITEGYSSAMQSPNISLIFNVLSICLICVLYRTQNVYENYY